LIPACHTWFFQGHHYHKKRIGSILREKMKRNGLILLTLSVSLLAQQHTVDEYKKALWMCTRMFGGQRSGAGPNWLIMDHGSGVDFTLDSDNGYDLSGGWHDCGDHVKFGQTQYYSAYVLLKAYDAFPRGFRDYYSFDYRGYHRSGDFSWEGGAGTPNGIPDILDEVKYAADYFIRCTRDGSTFYYQVGEGDKDHKRWVTSVAMAGLPPSEGGQPRTVFANPDGASMVSLCGATLALMSRVYKKFDPVYSQTCLTHARYAYEYAKSHPGTAGAADGSFYPANAKWEDDYVCLLVELYHATGEQRYKTEAEQYVSKIKDHYWSLCYNNNDDLAAYTLGMLGNDGAAAVLEGIVKRYTENVTGEGVGNTGNEWGALRYSAAQAFAAALNNEMHKNTTSDAFIYNTVDYILGKNSAGQSFVVGFGSTSPQHPHHRNVYLNDNNVPDSEKNNLVIPQRNSQFGFLVGGALTPGSFTDDLNEYQYTEGGIDYNAGLVGALAYIVSQLDPVAATCVTANRYHCRITPSEEKIRYGIVLNRYRTNRYVKTAHLFDLQGRQFPETGSDQHIFHNNNALQIMHPHSFIVYQ
jgi:hypothetical protein